MNGPDPAVTAAALWTLLSLGLATSLGFLLLHRPRAWLRPEAWNSSGWVIISALWFLRSVVLILMRGGMPRPYDGWPDAAVSLGFLLAVDVLLLVRFLSWWHWSRAGPASSDGQI